LAGSADDARTARLDHRNFGAFAQTEFMESMDLFRAPEHRDDFGDIASVQPIQGNHFILWVGGLYHGTTIVAGGKWN
jgi:hypothetical protein